jgi:hypothetical protein
MTPVVVPSESPYRDRKWTSPGPAAEAKQDPDQAQELLPEMDQTQGAAQLRRQQPDEHD